MVEDETQVLLKTSVVFLPSALWVIPEIAIWVIPEIAICNCNGIIFNYLLRVFQTSKNQGQEYHFVSNQGSHKSSI